jgi:hypothetical protein
MRHAGPSPESEPSSEACGVAVSTRARTSEARGDRGLRTAGTTC